MRGRAKKIWFIVVVFLVFIGVAIFLWTRGKSGREDEPSGRFPTADFGAGTSLPESYTPSATSSLFYEREKEEAAFYNTDTDGDGVSDWKEALLGLNPEKKDSDGDGISDGEEAASIVEKANISFLAIPNPYFLPSTNPPSSDEAPTFLVPDISSFVPQNVPRIASISPKYGSVGTTVTVSGRNFEPLNTVYTGFGIVRNVPSLDGKTIQVSMTQVAASLSAPPEGKIPVFDGATLSFRDVTAGDTVSTPPPSPPGRDDTFTVPVPIIVRNKQGISNVVYFQATLTLDLIYKGAGQGDGGGGGDGGGDGGGGGAAP